MDTVKEIFLLEDDKAIAMGLVYSLEKEGYRVTHAENVKQAMETIANRSFAFCILDINLPDGNGYEVCKAIKENSDTPVLFLTAYDDEVNVIMGLELGADDYICKPFRVRELMARIKAILRRTEGKSEGVRTTDGEGIMKIQDICIHTKDAKVFKVANGERKEIELTAMEYRLLLIFINNRGVVLSRNGLLEDIWDVSGDFVNDNTLTVYIKRLRDKIEDNPANPQIIKTVRGLGYILEKEEKP
ncbi:MAG: response regulator transcription factor [Lachnospiraceae bacterium]|nr:response regulator transcription factor [Lachnospiraceae bacterium]